jgi:hypothetical protein
LIRGIGSRDALGVETPVEGRVMAEVLIKAVGNIQNNRKTHALEPVSLTLKTIQQKYWI